MPSNSDTPMPNVREVLKVRITGGVYANKYYAAFLNPSLGDRGYTDHFMYLFIKKRKNSDPKPIRVRRENAELVSERVIDSYEAAVIDQHPKIEKKMKDLAKILARCDIQEFDKMGDIFAGMVEKATQNLAEKGDDMTGRIITNFNR